MVHETSVIVWLNREEERNREAASPVAFLLLFYQSNGQTCSEKMSQKGVIVTARSPRELAPPHCTSSLMHLLTPGPGLGLGGV